MENSISTRKTDHIQIVSEHAEVDRQGNWFDRIQLTHRALPELDLAAMDPSLTFMGKALSFPLLISSMTGGNDAELIRINRNLAEAAEAEAVALGVGSQRIALKDPEARESFTLRPYAPTTLLFGNIGAVQLNYGMGVEACQVAVDMLEADALFLHLNPLQEAVQPEGDTNFSGLSEKMKKVVNGLGVPVVVKEVGAGISLTDAQRLRDAGVRFIDVAGRGGTSWSMVESRRSTSPALGELFADWGLPTPMALRALRPLKDEVTLMASGGVRNGIDMVKCMILGASLCGLARPFLAPARESAEAVRAEIRRLRREFVSAMFLLGTGSLDELKGNESLVLNEDRY